LAILWGGSRTFGVLAWKYCATWRQCSNALPWGVTGFTD
jgi:hypothetical protein